MNVYYIEINITNGPNNTTVCINDTAEINCGFTGGDPETVFPDWRIILRSDNGSINNTIYKGCNILGDRIDGLQWKPDNVSGNNNSPNSKLSVDPVNKTHNQSSYQCIFGGLHSNNTILSEVGTITVVGKMTN